MSLKDLLYQDNSVIDDFAFIWDKSNWINDKSFGGFLNSSYDIGKISAEDIKSGLTTKNLINKVLKFYNLNYQKHIALLEEDIQFKNFNFPLSDHLATQIVTTGGATSLTLTQTPNSNYPCILLHKFNNNFGIWIEKVTGEEHYLMTFERNNAAITNITPSLSFTTSETIVFPKTSDTQNLEIYLNSWPIIPGSVSFTGGYNVADFEIDYLFGIIRSTTNFSTTTSDTETITYTTGVGALYIPDFIKEITFTHPDSIDNLQSNFLTIIDK